MPPPLPVDETLPALLDALASRRAAILEAPPGAGKTTRVPPAVAATTAGRVLVLEPRRVAARAAARRIAAEQGWRLGVEVGWWIRFERLFRPETRIVFATEGILLRWLQHDPFLSGVGAILFDEFHERALDADLAFALARQVQLEARPDLRLVVMSATLEAAPLSTFLGQAPVVRSAGRLHPVEIFLLERPDARPLADQVVSAVRRALAQTTGDLLVFLPGRGEIRRAGEALAPFAQEQQLDLCPLYGDQPIEAQDAALRAGSRRRVVLATNVAETSVTVEGVTAVVDSGWARQLRFDPATGLDRLETVRIARSSADQRAGRAGRQAPGLCLRLWNAADDLALRPHELPEIRRVDLTGAVLALSAWGERDPAAFAWFEPPEAERLERAMAELEKLAAIGPAGITPLGRRLAALPLPPRLGRLVSEGERLGVAGDAALLAALLAERDPSRAERRDHRAGSRSDLLDRLDSLRSAPSAATSSLFRLRDRYLETLRRLGDDTERERVSSKSDRGREDLLLRVIAAAFLDRLCRRREPGSDRAVMVGGRGVRLGRESVVREAELFVAVTVDAGRGGERAEGLVRAASAVEREWLPGDLVRAGRELVWDGAGERVSARAVVRFEDLVLEEKEVPIHDPEGAAELLAARALVQLESALALDRPTATSLRQRMDFLARARPELQIPAFDLTIRALLPGMTTGKRSYAELRALAWDELVLGCLEREQRAALARDAPERLEVPSGSRIRIDYSDPARPVLAVRLQEIFGLTETPRLAGGRVPLVLHLLAPSGRPQQITRDLASFWAKTYPEVRRELAGRYPKHAWPEDPLQALPSRRPTRRRS